MVAAWHFEYVFRLFSSTSFLTVSYLSASTPRLSEAVEPDVHPAVSMHIVPSGSIWTAASPRRLYLMVL